MSQGSISHADIRRLKLVLECGHELEKTWATLPAPSDLEGSRLREHGLARLIGAIQVLEQADAENIRRLSFHTRNLTLDMTARHLSTVLVPFERLLGKSLRDDEILIEEGDTTVARGSLAPMRVIADNLRSAFNVGAILRTAECFGVEHVSLAGYTPSPEQEKTARTSLGTEKTVSWSSDQNVHDVIAQAKRDGYEVIALETVREAVALEDFAWPSKCAILLGNERFGLDRDVLDQADHFVKIPMHGAKNSLNVGIACGIVLASWRETLKSTNVTYSPIARFRSDAVNPYEAPRQATLDESGLEGKIELPSSMREAVKDLEGFERVWLIYDFHHNKSWKPLVMPPRGAREKRGVFATRSPYRPNSVGLSCVELVSVVGTVVTVRSTDLLDGTPILDIKPYVPYADAFPSSKQGWLEGLESERFSVGFSSRAEEKLKWLESRGVTQLRGFAVHQLEFDPLDKERKRLIEKDGATALAYRTWRAHFSVVDKTITVDDISSGYTLTDLTSSDDKYADKDLHRTFAKTTWTHGGV